MTVLVLGSELLLRVEVKETQAFVPQLECLSVATANSIWQPAFVASVKSTNGTSLSIIAGPACIAWQVRLARCLSLW